MTVLPPEKRRFASDWFSMKTGPWLEHVATRLVNIPSPRWLEVGVYEGRSALWTLDHILKGSDAKIYCIDLFDPNLPYMSTWAPNTHHEDAFDYNVNGDPRVVKLKGASQEILSTVLKDVKLHGAYLDSDHRAEPTLREAALIWNLLLPGGVLVFDDYGYKEMPESKQAIDEFIARMGKDIEVLFLGFQAIVVKR